MYTHYVGLVWLEFQEINLYLKFIQIWMDSLHKDGQDHGERFWLNLISKFHLNLKKLKSRNEIRFKGKKFFWIIKILKLLRSRHFMLHYIAWKYVYANMCDM